MIPSDPENEAIVRAKAALLGVKISSTMIKIHLHAGFTGLYWSGQTLWAPAAYSWAEASTRFATLRLFEK